MYEVIRFSYIACEIGCVGFRTAYMICYTLHYFVGRRLDSGQRTDEAAAAGRLQRSHYRLQRKLPS
jgi:hypothetical protein